MANEFFRIEVTGFRELERALLELPNAVAKSVLRKALKKAGAPVVDAAQSLAPRATGALAESIEVKSSLVRRQRRRRRKQGDVELFIGATWPTGAHAHLLEFGTSKMAKRPFLRPAWDANKGRVLDIFQNELRIAIVKAARRLARKA